MHVLRAALFIVALSVVSAKGAVAATYKCVGGGKTTYQAAPCKGEGQKISVKPANGSQEVSEATKTSGTPSAPSTAALRANVDAMARERRLREIDHDLDATDREIAGYQSGMEQEMAALERKKLYANNNLAGATWEQSISAEMQAVSDKYKVKIQIAQDRASTLRKEAEQLRQMGPK
jgi:hypothetical protein